MNKKEHQIWQEIKYDEYLLNKHIFSYEKQLTFTNKRILSFAFYDSEEAFITYMNLIEEKKPIKKPQINLNPYNNKNHPIWHRDNCYMYDEDYMENLYGEICLVKEDGKYIQPYEDYEKLKYWA